MIKPKKHMGQNFLVDKRVLEQMATHVYETGGSRKIVEIGAGTGNLTAALLKKGSREIVSVELDSRCTPYLNSLKCEQLQILHQDARKINWLEMGTDLHIVGNLPYNLASQLILQWGELTRFWKHCTIMVQKEVADRVLAGKGSGMSILTSLFFNSEKILSVKPGAFYPRPMVYSTVVHLTPKNPGAQVHLSNLKRVLRILFARRRKMISHALDKTELEELRIRPTARPEELTLDQFILLANNLKRLLCD